MQIGLGLGAGAHLKKQNENSAALGFPMAESDFHFNAKGSYAGVGAQWHDLRGGNVFTLQGNPVFANGAMILDGAGDYLKLDANPDWLAGAHQDFAGNQWWFAIAGTIGVTNSSDYLMGTWGEANQDGIAIRVTSSGALQFFHRGGGVLSATVGLGTLSDGDDFILVVSYDTDSGVMRYALNDYRYSEVSVSFVSSSGAADGTLALGALQNGSGEIHSGTQLHGFMGGGAFLDVAGFYQVVRRLKDRMAAASYFRALIVMACGQSNAQKLVEDYSSAGQAVFLSALGGYYDIGMLENGATGGAAADKAGDAGYGYFYDGATQSFGAAYDNFLSGVSGAALCPCGVDWIVWAQGETDALQLDGVDYTIADYEAALRAIFARLYADTGAKIALAPIGFDVGAPNSTRDEWQQVRDVQMKLADALSYVFMLPPYYDQGLQDDVHLDQSGYESFAARSAQYLLAREGVVSIVGAAGPVIVSGRFVAGQKLIYLDIVHDGGDDFSIMSDIAYWRVLINGNADNLSLVVRHDANTIAITTLNTMNSGDEVVVQAAPYGNGRDIMISSIAVDNAALPRALAPVSMLVLQEV